MNLCECWAGLSYTLASMQLLSVSHLNFLVANLFIRCKQFSGCCRKIGNTLFQNNYNLWTIDNYLRAFAFKHQILD